MLEILASLTMETLAIAAGGMALGIFFGALPGFGGGAAMAITLPLAITMSPLNSMVFLINVYGGTHYGGGIPSVLLGVPGDAGGAPTVIDGFPMTRKGMVSEGLAFGAMGSFVGATLSVTAFLFFSPMLARFALRFGPPEFFVLVVFGLTVLASIDAERLWKGLLAGAFGMALAAIGVDPYWAEERMAFGVLYLYEGLPFIPALLGFFCISQMMMLIDEKSLVSGAVQTSPTFRRILGGMAESFRYWRVLLQSSAVGTFIGALPAAGATISAFVAYTLAKNTSKHPERYGTGIPEGILATEAANSSNVGGALIPTFALGIPGSGSTAILMGVMMFMGLRPGPRLFLEQLELIHTLGVYLLFGCFLIGIFGALAAKYFCRMTRIPLNILIPCTIAASSLGAYSGRTELFDIGVMLVTGVFGYLMIKFRYPLTGLILGLVLGPMAEEYFIQSVELAAWDFTIFFTRPICIVLWICIAASLIGSRVLFKRNQAESSEGEDKIAL
jgi:putative tricarboxylic transport membrane protein